MCLPCEDLGREGRCLWPLARQATARRVEMAVEPQQQQQQQAGTGAAPNAAPATAGGGAPLRVVDSMSTRVDVINTHAGRILCVADVRGQSLALLSSPLLCRSTDDGMRDPRRTACRRRRRGDSTRPGRHSGARACARYRAVATFTWETSTSLGAPLGDSRVEDPLPSCARRANGVVRLHRNNHSRRRLLKGNIT